MYTPTGPLPGLCRHWPLVRVSAKTAAPWHYPRMTPTRPDAPVATYYGRDDARILSMYGYT